MLKDGRPFLVTGSPGGSRIITAVLQTMINAIDYDMNAQEAVDMPRFHEQWLPDVTYVENYALSPDTRKILEGMGHKFAPLQPPNHLGLIIIGRRGDSVAIPACTQQKPELGKNLCFG